MARLKIRLLGVPAFGPEGNFPLAEPGRKATALVAYLASRPDGRATRAELAHLLWGDAPSTAASRHALRQCLLRLRRALGLSLIGSDLQSVWIDLDAVEIDVRELERAAHGEDSAGLIAAAALCQGPFCATLDIGAPDFETWLRERRADLDRLAAGVNERAAGLLAARGREDAAIEAARRRVSCEPYDESAHAALIALLLAFGRRQEARTAHAACRALFAQELGIAPGPEIDKALKTQMAYAAATCAPIRVPSRNERPVRATVFAAVLALSAVLIADNLQVGMTRPAQSAPSTRLWVVPGDAVATKGAARVVVASEPPSAERGETGHVSIENAVQRALQGDPEFSRLYPAGC